MDNRPIGIFDSGLGGLTVLSEVIKHMPNEDIIYLGDNGRAPYGTKSKEIVTKYSIQNINFLLSNDVKMIVIACNTASACSMDKVSSSFDIPIVEVIKSGALAAIKTTKNKRIGVIGTSATIGSKVYEFAITQMDPNIKVFSKSCPLFVPLVEEGWWNKDISLMIAKEYLKPLETEEIDTLVLGCTHYPLLQDTISKSINENVQIINSAREVASVVEKLISGKEICRASTTSPTYKYYTSDSIEKFRFLGNSILNGKVNFVEKVDIEKY